MSAKKAILNSLGKKNIALGNTATEFKHIACDLLNALGEKPSQIAKGTFLSPSTIERVMECVEPYRPQSETLERIFRYCNAQVTFDHVAIKSKFQNIPKDHADDE